MCHSEFSWSLRAMPAAMSAQTLVISFQARSRFANSDAWSAQPE
jgi:hypothetical protein